jgi:hypothetical protein
MRDVRIDTAGQLRCWKCGCAGFKSKRTLRSKALVGVGALVTKKKLKCEACGEYNDTGRAKPYVGPASKRLGKKYGTFIGMHGVADGTEVEDTVDDAEVPAPPSGMVPAGWLPDPVGRHELRWWDGAVWTEHVSDGGVQGLDPEGLTMA